MKPFCKNHEVNDESLFCSVNSGNLAWQLMLASHFVLLCACIWFRRGILGSRFVSETKRVEEVWDIERSRRIRVIQGPSHFFGLEHSVEFIDSGEYYLIKRAGALLPISVNFAVWQISNDWMECYRKHNLRAMLEWHSLEPRCNFTASIANLEESGQSVGCRLRCLNFEVFTEESWLLHNLMLLLFSLPFDEPQQPLANPA